MQIKTIIQNNTYNKNKLATVEIAYCIKLCVESIYLVEIKIGSYSV